MRRPQRAWQKRGAWLMLVCASVLLMSGCSRFEALDPATDRGSDVKWMWDVSLWASGAVMLIVFVLLTYALLHFRGSDEPSTREGNTRLEIFWTAMPALLLTVLFVFTIRTMMNVNASHDDADDVVHVNVVGNQWWWTFEYPELGITTANELYLPVGRPVELSLTAKDVIHSFWVPEIGWKMDTLPGKTNTMRFTVDRAGVYDGACAEFCGAQHAWMRIHVVAQDADTFDTWASTQASNAAEPSSQLAKDGKATFLAQTCATCHTIRGVNESNEVGPDLTHFGSRETIGAGVVENNPENLEAWILDAQGIKPGVLMPAFDSLTESELDALVEYLRGLK